MNINFYKMILCTGCLLFFVTGSLWAQQDNTAELIQKAEEAGIERSSLTELQTRSRERGISEQQLSQIIRSAIGMSAENLPAEAVVQKALEGLSKGIPGDRILPVVERVRQSMGQAAEVVDPWVSGSEVQEMVKRSDGSMSSEIFRNEMVKAASKSIMQNIPSGTVSEILSQIGSGSLPASTTPPDIVAAMGILPDLPTAENRPEASGTFVVRALKGGFKADELQKLPSALKMAQQRSELPAASVIEGVANQMRGGIPAGQILQNLFDGKMGGGPPGNIPGGLDNRQNRGNGNR